jgi:hypothetical protein
VKKRLPLASLWLATLLLAAACSSKATYVHLVPIPPDSKFAVGEVFDETGFSFPENDDDAIVLAAAMAEALEKALARKALSGEGQWILNVTLKEYEPGNAFKRWLIPGFGTTRLTAVASVVDPEGNVAAEIPAERKIGFGGGYTVGAWRYVFDDLAEIIVESLVERERQAPTE